MNELFNGYKSTKVFFFSFMFSFFSLVICNFVGIFMSLDSSNKLPKAVHSISPFLKLLPLSCFAHFSLLILLTFALSLFNVLQRFMSESVWPMFSFKSFIVSGLIFRSLIYFNLYLFVVFGSVLFFYM